jgi:hypothetical protein
VPVPQKDLLIDIYYTRVFSKSRPNSNSTEPNRHRHKTCVLCSQPSRASSAVLSFSPRHRARAGMSWSRMHTLHTYRNTGGTCRRKKSSGIHSADEGYVRRPALAPRCRRSSQYRRWRALALAAGERKRRRRMRACAMDCGERKSRSAAFSMDLTPTSKAPPSSTQPHSPYSPFPRLFQHARTPTRDGP